MMRQRVYHWEILRCYVLWMERLRPLGWKGTCSGFWKNTMRGRMRIRAQSKISAILGIAPTPVPTIISRWTIHQTQRTDLKSALKEKKNTQLHLNLVWSILLATYKVARKMNQARSTLMILARCHCGTHQWWNPWTVKPSGWIKTWKVYSVRSNNFQTLLEMKQVFCHCVTHRSCKQWMVIPSGWIMTWEVCSIKLKNLWRLMETIALVTQEIYHRGMWTQQRTAQ